MPIKNNEVLYKALKKWINEAKATTRKPFNRGLKPTAIKILDYDITIMPSNYKPIILIDSSGPTSLEHLHQK